MVSLKSSSAVRDRTVFSCLLGQKNPHQDDEMYILGITMRKNLPKTLEQLIFCKYTLVFSKCSQIY